MTYPFWCKIGAKYRIFVKKQEIYKKIALFAKIIAKMFGI